MKFRTIDLRCLVCDLSVRFKVAIRHPDLMDLAVMEQLAWDDCPRCAEQRYVGKEAVRTAVAGALGVDRTDTRLDTRARPGLGLDRPVNTNLTRIRSS